MFVDLNIVSGKNHSEVIFTKLSSVRLLMVIFKPPRGGFYVTKKEAFGELPKKISNLLVFGV